MNDSSRDQHSELPEDLRGRRQLDEGEKFKFECHSKLDCFTHCCSDINILLTPLDVLRLSRRLGIETGEFLDQYTVTPITKELHLPVVALRMGDDPDRKCQLLGDQGCSVYEDRPWSCRMYPVGMGLPPARAGVNPEPIYFLFEDDYCEGTAQHCEWTVSAWRDDQQVAEREELEKGFQEIVSHPWFIGGRQLDAKRMQMFHTACFDQDAFRRFIFTTSFLQRFELESSFIEELKTDDEALLRFAFRWLRFALFAEPTMTPRDDAANAGKTPGEPHE